jgi:hypothetical protein
VLRRRSAVARPSRGNTEVLRATTQIALANLIARGAMSDSKNFAPTDLSSMFGVTPWGDYDVATRMDELRAFVRAGVVPALYDALRHVKDQSDQTPSWIIEESLKLVAEHLQFGMKQTMGSNDRGLYKRQIKSYYRWRCVHKYVLLGYTIEEASYSAAKELEHTFAKGSDKTFREAYYFVIKELQDPRTAFRYYSAMPDTRELTGTSLVAIRSGKAS